MFDSDIWQEIFHTIRKNRLRTFLTGFSVAWGIFMLVILLGSGTGLENGIQTQFADDAVNSIWVRPGVTSIAHKGFQAGRRVQFTNEDVDIAEEKIDGVEHLTARFGMWGQEMSYGNEYSTYSLRGTHPDHQYLEHTIIEKGRFINELDLQQLRKVTVIGKTVEQQLYKGKDAMGTYLEINGIPFKVVGVFRDDGNPREMECVYVPIATAQSVFNGGNTIRYLMFTVGDATFDESQIIAQNTQDIYTQRHSISPQDPRALNISNNMEEFERVSSLMLGIRIFIWIIGIGTIIAGVVGVSNIMMIVVKERTREIGVRKAIGANPWSIIKLIVLEAVLITSIAGYLGLLWGIGLLEAVRTLAPPNDFFINPGVDFGVAVSTTIVLIVAGTLAGLFPARKAAKIQPIEALRDE